MARCIGVISITVQASQVGLRAEIAVGASDRLDDKRSEDLTPIYRPPAVSGLLRRRSLA